jgi:ketosteroid isomerase-like protein
MKAPDAWRPGGPGWPALFAAIDRRDADAFAAFLTADGEFRFGNAPPVVSRPAVREAVAAFFHAIGGCRHLLIHSWEGPGNVACEGEVTYTRLDGRTVTVPFANVFTLRGGEISSYRVFIDNGPLFAP